MTLDIDSVFKRPQLDWQQPAPGLVGLGVYRAMVKVAKALSALGISKDEVNKSQGFSFRGIDDVLDALSRPLVDAGLLIVPYVLQRTQTERTSKSGATQYHVALDVEFHFIAAEDGSRVSARFQGEAADSGDKATSKAMSMAYKYMAFDTFCIPVFGLDDADASTPEPTVAKSKVRKVEAAPAAEPEVDRAGMDDDASDLIERILSAPDGKALGAMKVEVASFNKSPHWAEIKTVFTDRFNYFKKEAA